MPARPYVNSEFAERWEELYDLRVRVVWLVLGILAVGLLISVPFIGIVFAFAEIPLVLVLAWTLLRWRSFYCPHCGENFYFRRTWFGSLLPGEFGHCAHCGFKQWQ
jgi:hypothetical protein